GRDVMTRRILIVEDGREYLDAFTRLAGQTRDVTLELQRAGDLPEARELLERVKPDAVFLDVVFDRTPAERLAGDVEALIDRFGGDRARALAQLAENQGFYILDALLPLLP